MKQALLLTLFVGAGLMGHAQCTVSADFNLSSQTACTIPHTVDFTNLSTDYDTLYWEFGDGSWSNQTNPSYTYLGTGDFVVTLIATDTVNGCNDTATATVSIYIPGATITANPQQGCAPLDVEFSGLSFSPGTYTWDFGDGSAQVMASNPVHIFNAPGSYDIKIIHTAPNGCQDSTIQNNFIQVVGTDVDFSSDYVTIACGSPATVNFTDNSVPNGVINSWFWDFGDGYTVNAQNPSHNYNGKGSYTVSLTVTDSDGCTRTHSYADMIQLDSSYAYVDTSYICMGDSFTFLDSTTISNIVTDTVYTSNFPTSLGQCDSAYTRHVLIYHPDVSVTQVDFTLTANVTGAQYEWISCGGIVTINNEFNQSYTATSNGSYAVIVTENGCVDTSACYTVAGIGFDENSFNELQVYPNPTAGSVFINLPYADGATELTIRDLSGRIVQRQLFSQSGIVELTILDAAGTYLIEARTSQELIGRSVVYKR